MQNQRIDLACQLQQTGAGLGMQWLERVADRLVFDHAVIANLSAAGIRHSYYPGRNNFIIIIIIIIIEGNMWIY
jgi:hypothetical protein